MTARNADEDYSYGYCDYENYDCDEYDSDNYDSGNYQSRIPANERQIGKTKSEIIGLKSRGVKINSRIWRTDAEDENRHRTLETENNKSETTVMEIWKEPN